jgi:hypothetical protein
VDVYFVIVPIHNHVVAWFRNSDVRIVVIHDHVTIVALATTRPLRWTALCREESWHTCWATHPHALHEEHVRVMRIHLNIYLLIIIIYLFSTF